MNNRSVHTLNELPAIPCRVAGFTLNVGGVDKSPDYIGDADGLAAGFMPISGGRRFTAYLPDDVAKQVTLSNERNPSIVVSISGHGTRKDTGRVPLYNCGLPSTNLIINLDDVLAGKADPMYFLGKRATTLACGYDRRSEAFAFRISKIVLGRRGPDRVEGDVMEEGKLLLSPILSQRFEILQNRGNVLDQESIRSQIRFCIEMSPKEDKAKQNWLKLLDLLTMVYRLALGDPEVRTKIVETIQAQRDAEITAAAAQVAAQKTATATKKTAKAALSADTKPAKPKKAATPRKRSSRTTKKSETAPDVEVSVSDHAPTLNA